MPVLSARLAPASTPLLLDMGFVRGVLFYLAIGCLLVAPFVRDPLAAAAGGVTPWVVAAILAKPEIPAVVFYYLMTHWIQVVTRLAVSWIDNESLSDSLWGVNLANAYWYSLIGTVVLALGFRVGFARFKTAPSEIAADQPLPWQLSSLFKLYLLAFVVSMVVARIAPLTGGLAQPLFAVAGLRLVALFLLFVCALSSQDGTRWILFAMAVEIGVGFTGIFSDFKQCFIVLALAALAARPVLRPHTIVVTAIGAVMFTTLLLFWTGVKGEYRSTATGYSDSQRVVAPLDERLGWLGERMLAPSEINWASSTDELLRRIAYIDFFAATISASATSSDSRLLLNWGELIDHITRPRLLFPDKAVVDDTAVLDRLVGSTGSEDRAGTSISVGYLAENYSDLGFPMMLVPLFGLGLAKALGIRYLMTWSPGPIVGQAFALAFILSFAQGLGSTLAKIAGPAMVSFVFLALAIKFIWPSCSRLLK